MKNEVVAMRTQRNSYDHAIRATGATMVEVGFCDPPVIGRRFKEILADRGTIAAR
jgi:hypothetical protein